MFKVNNKDTKTTPSLEEFNLNQTYFFRVEGKVEVVMVEAAEARTTYS